MITKGFNLEAWRLKCWAVASTYTSSNTSCPYMLAFGKESTDLSPTYGLNSVITALKGYLWYYITHEDWKA